MSIKKQLLITLLLILPVALGARSLAAGRINVISLNLRTVSASGKDGANRWDNRKSSIVKMLKEESPDIFGIQEGYLCQIDYLSENCTEYSRVGVGRDDGKEAGEFCSIYYRTSRFKLVEDGNFWLSDTPEKPSKGWGEKYYRIVSWARLMDLKSGRTLVVFNTHFPLCKTAQENAISLLNERISAIAQSDPVVICADWNLPLASPLLTSLLENFSDLRTSFRHPDTQITYNAFGLKKGGLIDHIFYSGLKPLRYYNLNRDYGVPYISDHYPIKGVFRL